MVNFLLIINYLFYKGKVAELIKILMNNFRCGTIMHWPLYYFQNQQFQQGGLTEWLRWLTRNQLGNSRVGSSPAAVENRSRKPGKVPVLFFSRRGPQKVITHISEQLKVVIE